MPKTSISVIKADIGSFPGHSRTHPKLLEKAARTLVVDHGAHSVASRISGAGGFAMSPWLPIWSPFLIWVKDVPIDILLMSGQLFVGVLSMWIAWKLIPTSKEGSADISSKKRFRLKIGFHFFIEITRTIFHRYHSPSFALHRLRHFKQTY